ncbi:sulfur carrier protein ThiS [Acetobacter fallax]|uniref:Sulfur carrier protein ThiS n=1 Tax=Acetobacter fallax TaxID=1737473 RepID=A0ABX0K4T7_9PROT|nr:sulfur carrier protein ThiS [Acetobacter fallax]NHO31336.1 sulfur carrier protein ThiS [Acetobacter fallax]NHO34893.1 sulfur carrier protein ThiS [Acetobacter fallax]
MNILVNDETHVVTAGTLASLVAELGFSEARIATAIDGEFVPKATRGQHALAEGMRVEIVAPMQGG